LRLMLTALHDRAAGIAAEEGTQRLTDAEAMDLLRRMLRQRELSVARYEKAGRMELAEQERREIAIIREFLPRPLSDEDLTREVDRAVRDSGAHSIRDLGRVMALLRSRFPGRIDLATARGRARDTLA